MSISTLEQAAPTRVLVVDDDEFLLRATERSLTKAGYCVTTAASAEAALGRVDSVDLVIADDGLPGMRGSALLESIRTRGSTTPFILMTGSPTVEVVMGAYEGGVTSFLTKPFRTQDIVHRVRVALEQARDELAPVTGRRLREQAERCRLHGALDRALAQLTIAFQPIVSPRNRKVFGFEALMRSSEPTLPHPGAILDAAESLDRLHDVGRRVRERTAEAFRTAPAETLLFVNLHPYDLTDEDLFRADAPLAAFADRVVLEITERADLHQMADVSARLERLRGLGYRVAVDDLGAGYAGLTSLVELDPDVVKLDMALVRGIHKDPRKRRVVGSLVRLCAELDRAVIAEGVEEREELEVLRELGCELFQGYLLARPGPPFPEVRW